MTAEELEIVLSIEQHGLDAIKDVRNALAELAVQATITNTILESMDLGGGGKRGGGGGLGGGLMAFLQAMPGQTWVAVVVALGIAIAAAFAPLTMLILSATVAVTAFTVGLAGLAVVVGGLALPFAALGGAVLLLGGGAGVGAADALTKMTTKLTDAKEALVEFDQAHTGHLTILQQQAREQLVENIATAQANYNTALQNAQGPMGVLIGQLDAMKDVWAAQAAPMALMITQFAGGLIPLVQSFGTAVLSWFGERLPGALKGIGQIIKDLTPDFQGFMQFIGQTFDHVFNKDLTSIIEGGIRVAIQGAEGLITNLVRLSDWFEKNLPALGPIVAQVFGKLGDGAQGLVGAMASLVGWVEGHWKDIVANAGEFIQGWKSVDWKQVSQDFHDIADSFTKVDWKKFSQDMGTISGYVATLLPAVVEIVSELALALITIDSIIRGLNDFLHGGNTPTRIVNPARQGGNLGGDFAGNPTGGGNRTTTIIVNGTDTNNAGAVANTVARNLRKLGVP